MPSDHATASSSGAASGGAVVLSRHFEIYPDVPLTQLDSPHAKAFQARDKRSPDRPMYALLCQRHMPPRLEIMRGLSRMEGVAMIRPQAWGIAVWPLDGRECYLVVLDQPTGPRVRLAGNGTPPIREDELLRSVIPSMANLLRELKGRMISHRAVRLDNLFFTDESRTNVILGECVSEPAAYSQPAVYEPVDSAMANPAGRGIGYPSEDVYAMGVLLLALLTGVEPCAGMSDEEIIDSKIRLGSYATLVHELKVSINLMEPLRGMLCDSPAHRWTADDLEMWTEGKRQTSKPHSAPVKMGRPFEFNGLEYWHASTLAHGMANHWDEAVEAHPANPILTWLRKSFGNSSAHAAFLDRIQYLVASANKGPDAADRVVATLLTVLDTSAPLRFRSVAVQPEAIGQVLAIGYRDPTLIQDFAAAARARLFNVWMEMQPVNKPEFVPLKRAIELTQHFLDEEGWGFGLERCLYELNATWPCESPLLERFLVVKIDRLIPALESLAADGPPDYVPVDAHIAAYCAAHIKDLSKQVLVDLSEPPESPRHRLAVLSLLAKAQGAGRSDSAPALCRWMFRCLSPVITAFHNRPYRQKLAEQLQALAERGQLGPMLALADNPTPRERDHKGFERARENHARAAREIAWLGDGGLTRPETIRKGSEQASLLLSSLLSGMALLALTLVMVL